MRGPESRGGKGRILFVQHQDDCPPGYLGERAVQRGFAVDVVAATGELPDPAFYDLVVPLGSDDAAHDDAVPYLPAERALLQRAVAEEVPVFGVCFGAQLLARVLGGDVAPAPSGPEIGWLPVHTADPDLVEPGPWLVWHLDVMTCPPGGTVLAHTGVGVQAFSCGPHLGVQFHPEATPTSAEIWSRHYSSSLAGLGIDAAALLAETRRRAQTARERAHRLFDRVLQRSHFPRIGW